MLYGYLESLDVLLFNFFSFSAFFVHHECSNFFGKKKILQNLLFVSSGKILFFDEGEKLVFADFSILHMREQHHHHTTTSYWINTFCATLLRTLSRDWHDTFLKYSFSGVYECNLSASISRVIFDLIAFEIIEWSCYKNKILSSGCTSRTELKWLTVKSQKC